MRRSASSSVITAVVTHAPEKVIQTRPSEPWPCRVTITVACSPSGVEIGNAALNVSYGVLTAGLVQPGRRSFRRRRAKVAL
jgi:hypothetical protein